MPPSGQHDSDSSYVEDNVTDEKKSPPKPEGYSVFRAFLQKIAKVPKQELDEQERVYRQHRERAERKKA